MRVLLISYAFPPSIGGVETASLALAEELLHRGHEVAVATATKTALPPSFAFDVYYRPTAKRLLALHRWADVVIQNSFTLRFAWPLLISRRPLVVIHTGDFRTGSLRTAVARRAENIAVSQAVAQTIPVPSAVIPNAYRNNVFFDRQRSRRNYQFGFVGRLVSDKGVDNLLQALAVLGQRNLRPRCAIVGAGPEEIALKTQAQLLHVDAQVDFLGPRHDGGLVEILNDIDCLVVPSIWNEPFGIVALEGIASGCVVIGSHGGGLKDAIGSCGLTYPNGDVTALAAAMRRIMEDSELSMQLRAHAPDHLARHSPSAVVDDYLKIIAKTIGKRAVHGPKPFQGTL